MTTSYLHPLRLDVSPPMTPTAQTHGEQMSKTGNALCVTFGKRADSLKLVAFTERLFHVFSRGQAVVFSGHGTYKTPARFHCVFTRVADADARNLP